MKTTRKQRNTLRHMASDADGNCHVPQDVVLDLLSDYDEWEQRFDFYWKAEMRAVELWRELEMPDKSHMTVWLLERLQAAENATVGCPQCLGHGEIPHGDDSYDCGPCGATGRVSVSDLLLWNEKKRQLEAALQRAQDVLEEFRSGKLSDSMQALVDDALEMAREART